MVFTKIWNCYGKYSYGSIPIHTIFRGMNIHLPAILMWTTGGFDPSPYSYVKYQIFFHNYDSNVPMTDPPRRDGRDVSWGCPESFCFFLWLKFGEFPRKIEVWIAGEIWMCKSRKDQQPSLDSQMIQWCHYDKWQQQQRPGGFLVKQSTRPGKLTVCYWKLLFSSLIYPVKIVIFHSYVNVYQRVPHSNRSSGSSV